jgi:pimeloyl-ACP methyl ester carboxylesterase
LVHGTSADHARWDPVVPALGERFSVYAIDRRGQAGSGDAAKHSLEREAEDVAAVLDAVAGEWGVPVGLVGHSYGAICCLEEALRLPERLLGGLVLYEPPLLTGAVAFPAAAVGRVEALIEEGDRDEAVAVFLREVAGMPPTRWSS